MTARFIVRVLRTGAEEATLTSASYLIPCSWELAFVLEAKEESLFLFFFAFAFSGAMPRGMKDLSYPTRD